MKINGFPQNINNLYYYNYSESITILIWNININSTEEMFWDCYNVIEIDLSNFDTSQITTMKKMFYGCKSLTSLDLSNFNTSQVRTMDSTFYNCQSLTSLNISNFDTSKVNRMYAMFSECSKLILLDLSNFDTSQVICMENMFKNCLMLSSIDLSSFQTSQVSEMHEMFFGCESLTSLNITNFDVSIVGHMYRLFYNCRKLISLDLSNFYIKKNSYGFSVIYDMFSGCEFLEYINFKIAKITTVGQSKNMFANTRENLMVCSKNDNDILNQFLGEKINLYCIKDNSFQEIYKCQMKNAALYNKYACNICGDNFLKKYHLFNENNYSYINCFESKDFYFLDENDWSYKECYNSCLTCEINGNETNNNCLKCKDEYIYELNISNSIYKNCYKNNPIDINNKQNLYTSELLFLSKIV